MARERWFYAQGSQRRGPVSLAQMVEALLGQPDPLTVLVWKKGFAGWTRAEDVPEVERRLAPFIAKTAPAPAPKVPVAVPVEAPPPRARVEEAKPGSPALVYGGIAAGVAVLGLLGWLFWPRAEPVPPGGAVPLGGTTAENAPAVVLPAGPKGPPPTAVPAAAPTPVTPSTTRPAPPTPLPAVVSDREANLSAADLRKLRPVWVWEGDRLRGTVYNGTGWRVTELYVRVSRFINEDFTEDRRPLLLLPPGSQVDAGVADLLSKVAPDRKKPGLNPLDTGIFEGKAGARPENFRAEIDSARGYAPSR
ncbi:MAG TPA: GYF domain-containing protein [Vicinamibacteria bacterium]